MRQQKCSGKSVTRRSSDRVPSILICILALGALFLTLSASPQLSVAAALPMAHNSDNIGTKYGVWGTTYTCNTCHLRGTTANIKFIRSTIDTPTGPRPVIFNKYTTGSNAASGGLGNDERTLYADASRNICEVCHHQTIYHEYSSSKLTSKSHTEHKSNRKDCTQCHAHRIGFKPPPPGDCSTCHGDPPTSPTQLITNALGPAPPADAGAHQKHRIVEGMACSTCHNGYGHGLLGNDLIEMGFNINRANWPDFTGVVTSGTIVATKNPGFNNGFGVAPGNAGTFLNLTTAWGASCAIYCHGDGWNYASGHKRSGPIPWTNGPLGNCSNSACHGTTPAAPPTPVIMGNVSTGAHKRHVGKNAYDCTACHDSYSGSHMVNGHVKWNLSSQGGAATYKGFNSYSTAYLATTGSYGSCSNIYCHSNVQGVTGTATASSFQTPLWGGATLGCNGCHASPMTSGNHGKHTTGYGGRFACGDCHNNGGRDNEPKHADGNIDVSFSATYGGSYSQVTNPPANGFGTCSASYCHSNGLGVTKSVSWGSNVLACNACHDSDLASGTPLTTGKHPEHINNAALLGRNFSCNDCHANTVSSNSVISNFATHVNTLRDYSGAGGGKNRSACNSAYCHSDGKGRGGQTVSWSAGPALDCSGCHGSDSAPAFTSVAGEPNYVNGGAGQLRANNHQRHMGGFGATTCLYCHNLTMSPSGSLLPGSSHLNRTIDVQAGGGRSFNWTPGTKSCDSISCHGGSASIQWGAAMPVDCTGCHGGNFASANPQTSGKHAAHMNQAALLGTNYPCATCHALTVSSDRTIVDPAYHGNGFKNFTGSLAGGRTSYTTATGVCSATYCHSDGKGTQKDLTSFGWKSAATLDCKGCHGSDAAPAFASVAGEPNYASTGAGTTRANSHLNHGDGSAASCVNCHAATVNATGTVIVGSHTNRSIDLVPGNGHSFTFTPASKSCAEISCHGGKGSFTQVWGAPMTPNCLGCHGNNVASGTPITSGRHTAHINNAPLLGSNYSCTECHAKTINPDERSFAYPANHGNGFKDYSGVRAGRSSSYTPATGVCSASLCHTDGKGTQKNMAAAGWNSGVTMDCSGCHGSDAVPAFTSAAGEPNYTNTGANQPRSNSHEKHVGTSGQAATCSYCHGSTVNAAGTAIVANHIDRTITVVQGGGKSFTWSAGAKSCATISCHGNGSPLAQWGQIMPADCTGCHGGRSGAATVMTTSQHAPHVNNAGVIGTNIGCASCHANTVSNDTTVIGALHANGLRNYSGALGGRNKAACNAAYCHSDGKGASGVAVSWTAGPVLGCTGCHGSASAPAFTSLAGEPNYANEGAALPRANSHKTHASAGASTCDTCHTSTVTAAGTAIKAGSLHLDQSININFNPAKATALWDSQSKTCSNISCHGGNNATWGDPNSAGCTVCHGSLAGSHAAHIGNYLTLGMTTYGNFSANRSGGSVYRFGCANCHPTDIANHRNGYVDVTLNKNKAAGGSLIALNNLVTTDSGGYTRNGATSLTCETVYCHSSGKSTSQLLADYRQTPDWYGGTFANGNKCGGCHDNPPQYLGQSHYVASSYLGNNGSPPYRESGHMINIHYRNTDKGNNQNGFLGFSSVGSKSHGNPAVATTISCNICHSGVVDTSQPDTYAMNGTISKFRCGSCHTGSTPTPLQTGRILDTTLHVNGAKNVAFAPITFKTKAQLANVANALGWTRHGSYKADDSYDSADLTASTWDPQTKTCLTACHVNQPGITWGAQLQCVSCHANQ